MKALLYARIGVRGSRAWLDRLAEIPFPIRRFCNIWLFPQTGTHDWQKGFREATEGVKNGAVA